MKMSETGIAMLTAFEAEKSHMYLDQVGLPTIGVGHLLTKSELSSGKLWIAGQAVRRSTGLTEQQMRDLLAEDLDLTEVVITDAVQPVLTQPQFDALVSFTFNIGEGAFEHSTLLALLNGGNLGAVPDQMRRWVYAKGIRLAALEQRREVEIARWEATV